MKTALSKLSTSLIYFAIGLFSLACIIPFIMVVSGSLTSEEDIFLYGYSLIPRNLNFTAYKILFVSIDKILNAYKVSIIVTVFGSFASLLVNALMAYTMSRKNLKYRKVLSVYSLITLLFTGGMVPWYIVCANLLQLKDNYPALIVPYLANAWYIFLLRNFLQSIHDEMHESGKIDGAGEYTIFFKIILPLMTPALATVGMFTALGYWNDWWLGLMLINKAEYQPLQLLLRSIVSNIQFLRSGASGGELAKIASQLPSEGIKMAVCVLTIGPIVFLYPFIQRYFVKGIMLGAVKG